MKKTKRRQQILLHARDIFAKRGYHAAKIDDIVAAAGIARGTFYLYFEDKRAIFEEILDRVLTRLGMSIVRVDPADEARTVADQVRENIRRIIEAMLDDPATTKILLGTALGVDPAFDRKLLSFYDEVSSLLQESLEEGQALGVIVEGDARTFTFATLGALKELLSQVVTRGWGRSAEQLAEDVFAFFSAGYLRVEPAQPRDALKRPPSRRRVAK